MILEKIHTLIDGNVETNSYSKIFNIFSSSLIVVSVVLIILQSYQNVDQDFGQIIHGMKALIVVFFTIEYMIRLITTHFQYPTKHKFLPPYFSSSLLWG